MPRAWLRASARAKTERNSYSAAAWIIGFGAYRLLFKVEEFGKVEAARPVVKSACVWHPGDKQGVGNPALMNIKRSSVIIALTGQALVSGCRNLLKGSHLAQQRLETQDGSGVLVQWNCYAASRVFLEELLRERERNTECRCLRAHISPIFIFRYDTESTERNSRCALETPKRCLWFG